MKIIFVLITIISCDLSDVLNPMRWVTNAYRNPFSPGNNPIFESLDKSAMLNRHSSEKALQTAKFVENTKANLLKYSCGFGDFGLC